MTITFEKKAKAILAFRDMLEENADKDVEGIAFELVQGGALVVEEGYYNYKECGTVEVFSIIWPFQKIATIYQPNMISNRSNVAVVS